MNAKPVLLAALILTTGTVVAEDEWDWGVTPYLWTAGMDGMIAAGDFRADVSMGFSDIVNVLEGGALLRFEGAGRTHGFFGDLVYLAIEDDAGKDPVGGAIKVEADSFIGELGYRRFLSDGFAIDIGLRYWDFETTLTPSMAPAAERSSDWTDGVIGVRLTGEAAQNWNWVFRANVGAGGSDLALGMEIDLRREFSRGNSVNIGFKALDVDFEESSRPVPLPVDLTLAGVTIGYTFKL